MTDRELDAIVAEKLWSARRVADGWEIPGGTYAPYPMVYSELPSFSTSIAAAFLVVEEMRRRGFEIGMARAKPMFHRWSAWFAHPTATMGGPRSGQADDAHSLPRAICIAALRALGVEVTT